METFFGDDWEACDDEEYDWQEEVYEAEAADDDDDGDDDDDDDVDEWSWESFGISKFPWMKVWQTMMKLGWN